MKLILLFCFMAFSQEIIKIDIPDNYYFFGVSPDGTKIILSKCDTISESERNYLVFITDLNVNSINLIFDSKSLGYDGNILFFNVSWINDDQILVIITDPLYNSEYYVFQLSSNSTSINKYQNKPEPDLIHQYNVLGQRRIGK